MERGVHDVAEAQSEVTTANRRDAEGPSRGRRTRRPRGPGKLFKVLKKLWIPLVLLAVMTAGGFTVSRLHGIFAIGRFLNRHPPWLVLRIHPAG